MTSVRLTEKLEEMSKGVGLVSLPGSAPQSENAPKAGSESFEVRWDESKWAQGILNQDCVKASRAKLDNRVADFLAVAIDEEKESLSGSRDEFQRLVTEAIEARKLRDPDSTAAEPSLAERLKRGWSATSAAAYEYIKILDVMVGQAPEYVGPVYGAIKILLVAQVNNEEVKEKVKGYLEQIRLKFETIDHLTAYMPSARLVTLIAQAYCLFNAFVAKAIKHYTQPRLMRYLMAFTMPWRRFQDIVDSIESELLSIKDVAQYVGLIEGHTTMMVSQQTLALLQKNMEKNQETSETIEEIRFNLHELSLNFSRAEGIRQTADALAQLVEERLSEPTVTDVDSSVASESGSDVVKNFDSWHDTLFPELRESGEAKARQQRADEELPNMREYRSKRKSLNKSEILWINGNEVLSREDFNASFVCPLMLIGESNSDTFIRLQHFCEDTNGETDPYVVKMQDLVAQVLRQLTSISPQQRATITRERTSTTEGLWELLLELVSGTEISCAFLVVGGIDHMVTRSSRPAEMRAELIHRFRALTTDTHKGVKVMVAMGLFPSTTTNVENISSLVRARQSHKEERRLSLDCLSNAFPGPLMSQDLTTIQEGRCRHISFTEIPLLYPPGTMVYTHYNDSLTASIVSEMSGMEPRPFGLFAPLRLRVWSIDHDGRHICKRYQDLIIKYFIGQKDVCSLTCIPSGNLPGELAERKQIIQRGQLYWSHRSGVHFFDVRSQHGKVHGIIDQSSRPLDSSFLDGLEPLNIPQEATVKSRFLMLSPAEISVYMVRELNWSSTSLEKLGPMDFRHDPLKELELDSEKKQLLEEAVVSYPRTQQHQARLPVPEMDLHSNIANRLLLLFYGGPGTGQSLAAKCLANCARCPLLVVAPNGMNEIRSLLDRVRTVFDFAKRWNCLVLIDNPDTVLGEMLDLIENHQGIVIMSTNHFIGIDHALASRIDIAVEFELHPDVRHEIWMNGLKTFGDGRNYDDDRSCDEERSSDDELKYFSNHSAYRAKKFSSLCKHELNGHTTMDILQSASRAARRQGRDINL